MQITGDRDNGWVMVENNNMSVTEDETDNEVDGDGESEQEDTTGCMRTVQKAKGTMYGISVYIFIPHSVDC